MARFEAIGRAFSSLATPKAARALPVIQPLT
jgi:hypothetical protein